MVLCHLLQGCFGLGNDELSAQTSLFGLLQPMEFIFSVDNSVLWQRHVSWAKPNGSELRSYYTQRYAATLGFLTFLLGGEIGVFFNSAVGMTAMRDTLKSQNYNSLLYWIGLVMLADIIVSIVGIVSTFTVWGMVSAISDRNTHALLRSSIGLYVIGLPQQYVVASTYLYLLWFVMWMIYIISGPVQYAVVGATLFMFFQVVPPLSAFGRLIMYSGAMSQKPVLDEKLEKQLLPSGLHSALLIKATQRQRAELGVTEQYRRRSVMNNGDEESLSYLTGPTASLSSSSTGAIKHELSKLLSSLSGEEDNVNSVIEGESEVSVTSSTVGHYSCHHNKSSSTGSDIQLPRASVLNSTISKQELDALVDETLPTGISDYDVSTIQEAARTVEDSDASPRKVDSRDEVSHPLPPSPSLQTEPFRQTFEGYRGPARTSLIKGSENKTKRKQGHRHRKTGSRQLFNEWATDNHMRNLYGEGPAPELMTDEIVEVQPNRRKRNSFLRNSFKALRMRHSTTSTEIPNAHTISTDEFVQDTFSRNLSAINESIDAGQERSSLLSSSNKSSYCN